MREIKDFSIAVTPGTFSGDVTKLVSETLHDVHLRAVFLLLS
jgi:hypothetical protein